MTTTEPFTLDATPADASLSTPVPRGWTAEHYQGFNERTFKRAVDPDGCRWYLSDGQWTLNVPYFRRSPGLARHLSDNLAVVDHVNGHLECPITEGGTIKIGSRRIPSTRWNH